MVTVHGLSKSHRSNDITPRQIPRADYRAAIYIVAVYMMLLSNLRGAV